MVLALGKRKRRSELKEDEPTFVSAADADASTKLQALFRQHFEAKFEPLPEARPLPVDDVDIVGDSSDETCGSDWDGLSNEGESHAEVVEHTKSSALKDEISKEELKSFMTTKPPSSTGTSSSRKKRKVPDTADPEEADTDAQNLKKDLALQRLLKESHLLDPQSSLSHSGQNRHKALDMRLQDMGSKTSIFSQQNMPRAQRKGILAKAAGKEESRRRQAQENGIILEKATKGGKKADAKRQRGIGAPIVGRFQGGMLKLSKKDISDIEGPKPSRRGKG